MDLALNNLQKLICHKPNQPTFFSEEYAILWDYFIYENGIISSAKLCMYTRCLDSSNYIWGLRYSDH